MGGFFVVNDMSMLWLLAWCPFASAFTILHSELHCKRYLPTTNLTLRLWKTQQTEPMDGYASVPSAAKSPQLHAHQAKAAACQRYCSCLHDGMPCPNGQHASILRVRARPCPTRWMAMWPGCFRLQELLDVAEAMSATVLCSSLEEGGLNVADCGEKVCTFGHLISSMAEHALGAAVRGEVLGLDQSWPVHRVLCLCAATQLPALMLLRWKGSFTLKLMRKRLTEVWQERTWAQRDVSAAGELPLEQVTIAQLQSALSARGGKLGQRWSCEVQILWVIACCFGLTHQRFALHEAS